MNRQSSTGPVQPHRGTPTPGAHERVLVVDDEPDVRLLASRILERIGYQPVPVESAAAALHRLDNDHTFAAILTDLAMPAMDGIALARTLARRRYARPVVLMTGRLDEEARQRALDAGVAGIVQKPFGVGDLATALSDALDHVTR